MKALIVIIALTLGVQIGQADSSWSSYVNNHRHDFIVTDQDTASSPVWNENEDQPPLAARNALRLAKERLAQLVPDSKSWKLDLLSLKEIKEGRWIYLARFEAPQPALGIGGVPITMTIPVLMKGATVKPQITPRIK